MIREVNMTMKSVEQLDVTKPADVTQNEVWDSEVQRVAEATRVTKEHILVNEDLKRGEGFKTLHQPVGTPISSEVSNISGGTTSPTTVNLQTTDLTPETWGVGVTIHQDAISESNVDLIKYSTDIIGESLAQKHDENILGTIAQSDNAGTISAASGDGTGNLTFKNIADAKALVEANDYTPDTLILDENGFSEIATLNQFTSAAKYGSPELVQEGRLPQVLGMDLITTTNVKDQVHTGTASCVCMDGKKAVIEAVSEDPAIEEDYEVMGRSYKILGSEKYACETLDGDALSIILTD